MKKQILEELNDIKYLFNYNRGKVISEQEKFESEDVDFEEIDINDYDEDEEEDINYLKGEMGEDEDMGSEEDFYPIEDEDMDDGEDLYSMYDNNDEFTGMGKSMGDMEFSENTTREKERIKVDPGTKPKQPKTPYKPKPGPKPDPKAEKRKNDIPDWLSFDELGIDFE